MKPFRKSVSATIIGCAASFALIAGGLVPTLGLNAAWAVPVVLLLTAGAGIVGVVLGIQDHPGKVALLAMMLPLALWPYTMVFIHTATQRPAWALGLSVAGLLLLGATLAAAITAAPEERYQRLTSTEQSA
jgi:hypothetical protein